MRGDFLSEEDQQAHAYRLWQWEAQADAENYMPDFWAALEDFSAGWLDKKTLDYFTYDLLKYFALKQELNKFALLAAIAQKPVVQL